MLGEPSMGATPMRRSLLALSLLVLGHVGAASAAMVAKPVQWTDHGVTYILDSDFQMLFDKNPEFFPKWFTDAFVWHRK